METMFVTIGFMAMLMLVMAVGVIFKGQPLKGSCGGMGTEDCLCLNEDKPIGSCDLPDDDQSGTRSMAAQESEDGLTVYE